LLTDRQTDKRGQTHLPPALLEVIKHIEFHCKTELFVSRSLMSARMRSDGCYTVFVLIFVYRIF